jgi:hypothetical protein
MPKKAEEQYSDQEAERRLVAALRSSRITGHKPMSDIPKKQTAKKSKRRALVKPKR